jgi:signal transduction histidine kinase
MLMRPPSEGPPQSRPPWRLGEVFRNLRVRPKLIVLHNLFFLVLTSAVYLSLIPYFEQRILDATEVVDFREGTAAELMMPAEVVRWLDSHPSRTWGDPRREPFLYRKSPERERYRRIGVPQGFYDDAISRARWNLFAVLGAIYVMAVLLLEIVIMPAYVYHPIRCMLDADRATRAGNRAGEIIPEASIPGDEIGQIMRSRNDSIGQLRRHEDELEQALRQLEAQDRLASLGFLTASVAHELNTPLSVLQGSIEKLLETVDDPPARERLARMLRVTQRLKTISEGLLDFSRVRRQEMAAIAMYGVIEEAWSLVAIEDKAAQTRFENRIPADTVVRGNSGRLLQVFVNLLRNALHAIPPGGLIVVSSEQLGHKIVVNVDDNGPGIPDDVLPEMFEAFVTSRLDSSGTGLGLTVAEGIVEQHGGSIHAENRPGGGARLQVRLPAPPPQQRNAE